MDASFGQSKPGSLLQKLSNPGQYCIVPQNDTAYEKNARGKDA
jgi:hypothetical protein